MHSAHHIPNDNDNYVPIAKIIMHTRNILYIHYQSLWILIMAISIEGMECELNAYLYAFDAATAGFGNKSRINEAHSNLKVWVVGISVE